MHFYLYGIFFKQNRLGSCSDINKHGEEGLRLEFEWIDDIDKKLQNKNANLTNSHQKSLISYEN